MSSEPGDPRDAQPRSPPPRNADPGTAARRAGRPRKEAQRLAGQMVHVESVIRMMDPTYNLRRIAVKRRKPNPWFKARYGLPPRRRRAQDRHGTHRPDKAALADLIGTVLASRGIMP